jgi:hypothetical protein
METKKELRLTEEYLAEVVDYIGRSLCGKILKKFEIVEDRRVLKSLVKESIYEELRTFRDILLAFDKGQEITVFKFKSKPSV